MTTSATAMAFARFGLGARLGDLSETTDVWAALHEELKAPNAGLLAAPALKDSAALYADVRQIQADRRKRAQAPDAMTPSADQMEQEKLLTPWQLPCSVRRSSASASSSKPGLASSNG